MGWPHQFVVVDQNQLRHPDRISRILDECCRNGLHILLPDGAFLEFGKSGHFYETARQSLKLLAPYRELIFSACKISDLMREELQQQAPSSSLIQDSSTEFLRSVLAELDRSEDTALRKLAEGPVVELLPPSLEVWNDHDRNKAVVKGIHDVLKAGMSAAHLKMLRASPVEQVARWLSSQEGTAFVFQGLKKRGANEMTAYMLTREPSVNGAFLSALSGLAVYWIAAGGIDTVASTRLSGDLNDLEYVILGSLARSFATEDRAARLICTSIASAFEARFALPAA